VGIAGKTGAGKTTLVSLLMRFYDPSSGTILLDGQDIRKYQLKDLRKQYGIVLQEPVLFSNSIQENIAYGSPSASREKIIEAAKAANAHEFITELPDGYDTLVGERGMRLSGGERQRISLARAFLRDAPILLLDEPTSAVDIKTEAIIIEAMERLMQGRTTFLIAHRLSTLENCDVLLEVKEGKVIQHEGGSAMAVYIHRDQPL
jgi:ATP-binding cassette subfamily B protein